MFRYTIFFVLLLFAVLWTFRAKSAPAMDGIAINASTKECGSYWAGDERTKYTLAAGWTAYYPEHNQPLKTEAGTCVYTSVKACCKELGLTYIEGNLGQWGCRCSVQNEAPPTDVPFVWLVWLVFALVGTQKRQKNTSR